MEKNQEWATPPDKGKMNPDSEMAGLPLFGMGDSDAQQVCIACEACGAAGSPLVQPPRGRDFCHFPPFVPILPEVGIAFFVVKFLLSLYSHPEHPVDPVKTLLFLI